MTNTEFRLEVGKHYVSRDGRMWGEFTEGPQGCFWCGGSSWSLDGRYLQHLETGDDLIREATPEEVKAGRAITSSNPPQQNLVTDSVLMVLQKIEECL